MGLRSDSEPPSDPQGREFREHRKLRRWIVDRLREEDAHLAELERILVQVMNEIGRMAPAISRIAEDQDAKAALDADQSQQIAAVRVEVAGITAELESFRRAAVASVQTAGQRSQLVSVLGAVTSLVVALATLLGLLYPLMGLGPPPTKVVAPASSGVGR